MRFKKVFLLLICCYCLPFLLFAQRKRLFDHNEGLSNSLINQVLQDHLGFIWVATEDGINRFDGIRYTSYSHNKNDSHSLQSNFVTSLAEDQEGNLWVGQINGLQIYDYNTETFREVKLELNGEEIRPFISYLLCSTNGDIWIATSGYGLFRAKKDTETSVQLVELSNRLSSHFIRVLFEDREGILWIGSDSKGLHSYDLQTDEVRNFAQYDSGQYHLLGNDVSSICQDSEDGIYVGSLNNGLVRLDKQTGQVKKIPSADSSENNLPVKSLCFDSQGRLWVGTDGFGLKLLNTKTNQLDNYAPSSSLFDFSKSKIHSIEEDRDGNLWVGIFQKGLYLFPEAPALFEHYGYEAFGKSSIGSSSITSLSGQGDSLWIGTDGDGIYLINRHNGSVHHMILRNKEGVVKGKNIMVLHPGTDRYLWIGTYSSGLIRYNKHNGSIKIYKHDPNNPNSLVNDKITTIRDGSDGELLLGTLGGGVCRFDPQKERFYPGLDVADTLNDQIHKWVNDIFIDKSGNYWVGTYVGLYYINTATKSLVHFSEANGKLPDNTVYCIQEDRRGVIWAGTYGGLVKIDPKTFSVKKYQIEDGLSSNVICAIQEDQHHQLWISTHNGLSRFDLKNEAFTNYFISDGVQSNEFSRNASFKTAHQELFFGGINGITKIKKNYHEDQKPVREVILTNFSLFNQPVNIGDKSGKHIILQKSIVLADTVKLRERDNVFSISFTSPELAKQSQILYEYRMEGFDEHWNVTNSLNRRATYTNLPYGTYTFYVRGVDKGRRSTLRELAILIYPPWYKTVWAKILWVLLVFALFYGVFLFHRERLLLKHAEKMNEVKMQFFVNISHEIKTPLSLILDPLEKLLGRKNDEKTSRLYKVMYQNANRIFRLVNQLMDVRKIDKGLLLIKFQQVNIYQFIQDITHAYDLLVASKGISLDIETTDPDMQVWIDPLNFEKVILNLLSNAFKHTSAGGNVKLSIDKARDGKSEGEEQLYIIVSDTGTGIPADDLERIFNRFYQVNSKETVSMGGTGIGLHLSRSLVELHRGKLVAENRTDGPGSKFIISIPLGNKHLPKDDLMLEENILPAHKVSPQVFAQVLNNGKTRHNPRTNYKIMVVDDEEEVRHYLVNELSDTYKVTGYGDGKEAFAHLLEERPDLILSDIMMSGMDGITLCKKVKGNVQTNHIPVVLLTALSKEENRAEGIETGADMYIVKPFNSDFLKKAIAGILENRKRIYEKVNGVENRFDLENTKLKSHDEVLMKKVMAVIKDNISERELNVEMLADVVGISRVHMHRKLKELTNQSARDLIRSVRMKHAAYILTTEKVNVSEVAYAVGYSNLSHFSHSFKAHFGISPKEYVENQCTVEE